MKQMELQLSVEDSLANPSAKLEKEKGQTTTDISGTKLLESLPKQNRNGLLEKMLTDLLTSKTAWYSDRCKMIWKKRVSKSNVLLFQLQASVLGTKEKESGSLPTMLPTPRTVDVQGGRAKDIQEKDGKYFRTNKKGEKFGVKLRDVIEEPKMYPTPSASCQMDVVAPPDTVSQNSKGWSVTRLKTGTKFGAKLNDVVNKLHHEGMYPTPTTQDSRIGPNNVKGNQHRVKRGSPALADTVLFPTPTNRDYKDTTLSKSYQKRNSDSLPIKMMRQGKLGGKLNPQFVEFLMGYPTDWTKVE
jgi:hypothetical protein